MLSILDLRSIARARLKDAEVLYASGRYDGAIYLCGYAIEIMLKARICRALKWPGYPDTNNEFNGYGSFRIHDLEILLHLSGTENKIRAKYLAEWSHITKWIKWNPNVRYRPIGSADPKDTADMIQATKTLLGAL